MLSIQTNVNSMNAQENLRVTSQFQGRTIARLTSGFRINESGDDAAGLAVANKYRSDVAELMQGVRNANDGLSALQIIDGGLNNISKMLDRMKTLATQSASSTFTGNRATLDAEFQSLLGEVDRQAANVGLGEGSAKAAQNNANIQVFIGGGASTSQSKVSVDLSGTSHVVNSAKLGLTGASVSGTGGSVGLDAAVNLNLPALLLANGTQRFTFATGSGSIDVTVAGGTAGITGAEVISQLNAGLSGSGISVSANTTTGFLQAQSATSFVFTAGVATNGTTATTAVAAGSGKINTSKYNWDAGAWVAIGGAATGTVTITPAGQAPKQIVLSFTATDTQATFTDKLKSQLAGTGVDVVTDNTKVIFQSSSAFTVDRGDDGVTGGFTNITDDMAAASALAPTVQADATTNALAALASIATAVTNLGNVQGKVGTGQNRLAYAIQLAQSQITSFSAAESRIRDADVAAEAANLTKAQVLQQASLAALAQANSAPQAVLSLLRG